MCERRCMMDDSLTVVVGFPCFVQVIIGWMDSALQCTFYGVRESNNAYASARVRVYVLRASSTYFINPKVSCNVTNDLNGPKLGLFERKNSTNSIFVTSPSLSVQRPGGEGARSLHYNNRQCANTASYGTTRRVHAPKNISIRLWVIPRPVQFGICRGHRAFAFYPREVL